MKLTHHLIRACVRKYPARGDHGRAFTAGLKLVLAQDLSPAVEAAALLDTLVDEKVAREHANALAYKYHSAGGKATVASHGPQLANGGKATVASHGLQMANGGRKSTTDSRLEFSPILSSHSCFPLLRS
jgi:hypothetical protein